MQRQGQKSAALARFEDYSLHARDLEKRKAKYRSGAATRRARAAKIISDHEAALDAAWFEIEEIKVGVGELEADVAAEHYLFCRDWYDVAAEHGLTYDSVKKRCYAALRWLDEHGLRG